MLDFGGCIELCAAGGVAGEQFLLANEVLLERHGITGEI